MMNRSPQIIQELAKMNVDILQIRADYDDMAQKFSDRTEIRSELETMQQQIAWLWQEQVTNRQEPLHEASQTMPDPEVHPNAAIIEELSRINLDIELLLSLLWPFCDDELANIAKIGRPRSCILRHCHRNNTRAKRIRILKSI